jgi:hypothetical protein
LEGEALRATNHEFIISIKVGIGKFYKVEPTNHPLTIDSYILPLVGLFILGDSIELDAIVEHRQQKILFMDEHITNASLPSPHLKLLIHWPIFQASFQCVQ